MNTKHLSHNMLLLILCSKVTPTEKDITSIQNLLLQNPHNYHSLIDLAHTQAMLPKLYKTLKYYFPKHDIITLLKPSYLHIVQVNMLMSTELIRCIKLLKSQKISILSFKGPTLAQLAYEDISLRQYGDLDILIKKRDRTEVISLLEKQHFQPEIKLYDNTKKGFFSAVNVLGFNSPKKDVFIEVHWELLSKNYAIFWEESTLWKHTQTIFIDKYPIETLHPSNHFLYLCVHGSKHLFSRLSWVCDIDHFIQTHDELLWEEVLHTARELGIIRILLISLTLANTLLQTPLSPEIREKISQDNMAQNLSKKLITLQFTNNQENHNNIYAFKLLWDMRENYCDKLRFAWYALFSAKFDDFKFVQLPTSLFFLYPFIRPLRLAIKYFK